MYDGIINVYKEKGFTSHDAVAKLRGILGQKKVGHTGTLDPAAEGVLPVCAGKGTRLCDMLTDHDKEYRAVLLLGVTTDTQDMTGEIVSRSEAGGLSEAEVREAVLSFEGGYEQVPPMYSALKVNGKRLYELAREGKEIERPARPVRLYEIVIEELTLPEVRFRVSCSKGTYIRTLCHDIGKRLGVGGCMKELCRLRVGRFASEDAWTLSELQALKDTGRLSEAVISLEAVFAELPRLQADGEALDRLIRNGNPFRYTKGVPFAPGAAVRVYDRAGMFTGVYEYSEEKTMFCPRKIFLGGN
ncbi:MAG: tRNA pseudouridine(55) synthase TruB [Lachnospiraceae bacterium]|nr:tRNA pseudouridine(55) synthase TruB [Lachnospiraceae bacterium]